MKANNKDEKEMLYYRPLLPTEEVKENYTNPNVSIKHYHKIRERDMFS